MSSNDIIYAPVTKRGIYIPDWAKIPIYLNVVSPGILAGIATVGFHGTPLPGIHFAVTEQCAMDILYKEIQSAIKCCMNSVPAYTIEHHVIMMQFKSCYDFDGRMKLVKAGCNTVEDNRWGGLMIYGQKFFDLQNCMHDMVDMMTGQIHSALIELTKHNFATTTSTITSGGIP
jgi:hypothetical protein